MARYVVRFMKVVLGENGHETEICQRSMEVDAADKLKAADLAKVSFCESECVKEWSLAAPLGLCEGRDQRVWLSGDRIGAAQRNGPTRSNDSWPTWKRMTCHMHAAEFWSERVEMMQVWADHLDQLRYGSPVDRQIKPFVVSQG